MICSIFHVFESSLSIDYLKIVRPPNLKCKNVQIMVFKNMNVHFLTYFSEAPITVIITRGTDLLWRKAKLALGYIPVHEEPRNILFLILCFFKYRQAFNSALLFQLFLLFTTFLDLLDLNLDLLFLKNAQLSLPFG